ncbi:hypothetical protein [Lacipirellula limnantheis]|uniref:Uncharacterized protein n=1 Tax=Lacipirellula limnantheis TaxID=2528024 RepID=A0A517TVV4_9BACT|nr:hypothetical protein [Lacipirellula limnantheis]QDT72504.1 hypothetical protein I41_16840 [Lacipirellula limnantheis]
MEEHNPAGARPRRIRLIAAAAIAVLAVAAVAGVVAFRATQAVDPFYAAAVAAKPAESREAGQRMENRVADLVDQAETTGRWQSIFSDAEVNGWLATILQEKYPTLLPPEVVDPRVSFQDWRCHIGYRYEGEKFQAVVTIEGEPFMASHDVAGLRLRKARIGVLPLPLSRVIEHINRGADDLQIAVKWIEHEGDPVMLVGVTNALSTDHEVRRLEEIELRQGELSLAGTATPRRGSGISQRARAAANAAAAAAAAAAVQ